MWLLYMQPIGEAMSVQTLLCCVPASQWHVSGLHMSMSEKKKKTCPTPLKISCLMKSAYRAKPSLRAAFTALLLRGYRSRPGGQRQGQSRRCVDVNPAVKAASGDSWEKGQRFVCFSMELRRFSVFWCGTILFGSLVLEEAGEFNLKLFFLAQ